ncbi:MAG: hypothetical protein AB7E84_11935 [Xanthobacteraceae bacterium]
MLNPMVGGISLAAAVAFVVAFGGSDANAQRRNPFDGAWSVNIQVTRGDCNSNALYGVVITNGSVRYAGGANVAVAGSVSTKGAVSVRVASGSQSAAGTGRLSLSGTGGGSWSGKGTNGRCSGRWSAQRSG